MTICQSFVKQNFLGDSQHVKSLRGNNLSTTMTSSPVRALSQIRKNVDALIKARGLDQKALAFAIHKHPTTINKFLKGTREVQLADHREGGRLTC